MKKLLPLFALALLVLAAVAPRASAQTSFLATDDAYVRGGVLGNTNFNTSWTNPGDALRCRQASADTNDRKTYVKFDFASYSGVVGTATLKIWVDRCVNSNGGNLFPDTAMVFTATDDTWGESTITWNNAPPTGPRLHLTAMRRRVTADPDTVYEWDVTNFIRTKFAGNKKATFMIWDSTTGHGTDVRMFSRETAGFEPELLISPTTDVREPGAVPARFALEQNYPNPFNPQTTIAFDLPSEQMVRLEVFSLLGTPVATLVNGRMPAGSHTAQFDASRLTSGVYFYVLTAGSYRETRRMMLVR